MKNKIFLLKYAACELLPDLKDHVSYYLTWKIMWVITWPERSCELLPDLKDHVSYYLTWKIMRVITNAHDLSGQVITRMIFQVR
jgi:hypothetical protein